MLHPIDQPIGNYEDIRLTPHDSWKSDLTNTSLHFRGARQIGDRFHESLGVNGGLDSCGGRSNFTGWRPRPVKGLLHHALHYQAARGEDPTSLAKPWVASAPPMDCPFFLPAPYASSSPFVVFLPYLLLSLPGCGTPRGACQKSFMQSGLLSQESFQFRLPCLNRAIYTPRFVYPFCPAHFTFC